MTDENAPGRNPETGAEHKEGPDPTHGTESEGGEGARNAEATPDVSVEGEHGQTSVPAHDDEEERADEETRREE